MPKSKHRITKQSRTEKDAAAAGAVATGDIVAANAVAPGDDKTAGDKPLLDGTVLRAFSGLYEVDVRAPLDASISAEEADAAYLKSLRDDPNRIDNQPDENDLTVLLCTVSGKLKKGKRLLSQPVSVGDRVRVRVLETSGADARGRLLREGYIEEVQTRTSVLARSRINKSDQVTVANLDQAVIVMSLREPELNTHRLDRFLVLAEASELKAVICLNKADLVAKRSLKKETKPLIDLYCGLGYEVVVVSAETDLGIEDVREMLRDHLSAVLGSSGVGKSSLINAVQPGLHLWVGDVMEIGKGRHTTTDVSLHRLNKGGYIADTPGIKTVTLLERDDVDLAQCFPEFRAWENECRFNNCTHLHEPGCAVRIAVEEKKINAARYESYRRMSEEKSEDLAY